MQADPVKNAVLVESVENCGEFTFLTVSLGGGEHWDLWQAFSRLPNVVEFNGVLFGKISWDSDKGRGYYRSGMNVAIGK